jgi:hypothetical protein
MITPLHVASGVFDSGQSKAPGVPDSVDSLAQSEYTTKSSNAEGDFNRARAALSQALHVVCVGG